jgi:6-pyruvoyltetrahydropterin/6-carboxytetrahydropterin synthase
MPPTLRLTRAVRFSAAHRYHRPEWSPERNAAVFGPCAGEHGHAWECHVTVLGAMDPATGMVINLRELDRILGEEIVQRLDHKHLNHDVPEFRYGGDIPTCEALALHLWGWIAPRLPEGLELDIVRVVEDPHLYAEYRGEGAGS